MSYKTQAEKDAFKWGIKVGREQMWEERPFTFAPTERHQRFDRLLTNMEQLNKTMEFMVAAWPRSPRASPKREEWDCV